MENREARLGEKGSDLIGGSAIAGNLNDDPSEVTEEDTAGSSSSLDSVEEAEFLQEISTTTNIEEGKEVGVQGG